MSEKLDFEQAKELLQLGYSLHRRVHRRRAGVYPVYLYWDRKEPLPKGMEKHYELEEWLDDGHYNILYKIYKSLRATPRLERRLTKVEEMEKPKQPELKEISERCMKLERQLGEEEKYVDYEMTRRNLLSQEETFKKRLKEKREERKKLERERMVAWFYETVKREFPFLFCPKCRAAIRFVEIGNNVYRANYMLWFRLYGADFIREKRLVLTAFKCPKCGLEGFVRCRQCNVGQLYMDSYSLTLARVRCNACEVEDDVYEIIKEEYKKKWGKSLLERIWNDEDTSAFDIFEEECKRIWKGK